MRHITALLAGAGMTMALPAAATLQLSAEINGITISCADQALCDTNAALGQLQIANQTVGGVQFLGSAQTQVIGTTNSLNTSSFQIINGNAGSIAYQVAVGGTGFLGPVAAFSASGSGTFQSAVGSDIDLTYFADTGNTQPADTPLDLPGVLLASDSKTALLTADSFSFNHTGAFVDPNLYSMALGTSGDLTGGGSLVGRSQSIVTTKKVNEPETLGLIGAALIGIGMLRLTTGRRRNEPHTAG